jgi:hypothetical protein
MESENTIDNKEIEVNNNNDLTLEDIYINLRVLSKLEIGNKLIKNNKHINIDSSYLQFVYRWYNGTNRSNTIYFITHILLKAFEISEQLIDLQTEESTQLLFRLNNELKNSINGLLNLKQTYSNDRLIQSEIDIMIDNIRTKLDLTSKNFNFVNSIVKSSIQEKKQILSSNNNQITTYYPKSDKKISYSKF